MKKKSIFKGKREGFFSMNHGAKNKVDLSTRLLSCVILLSCLNLFIPSTIQAQDYNLSLVSTYDVDHLNLVIDPAHSTNGKIVLPGYNINLGGSLSGNYSYSVSQDTVLVHKNSDVDGSTFILDENLTSTGEAHSFTYYTQADVSGINEFRIFENIGTLDGTNSLSFIDIASQNNHTGSRTKTLVSGDIVTTGQNGAGFGQIYGNSIVLQGNQSISTFKTFGHDVKVGGEIEGKGANNVGKVLKIDTSSSNSQAGDISVNYQIRGQATNRSIAVEMKANDIVITEGAYSNVKYVKVEGIDSEENNNKDQASLRTKNVTTTGTFDLDGDANTTEDVYGQYYDIEVEGKNTTNVFESRGKNIYFGKGVTGGSSKNDIVIDAIDSEEGDVRLQGGVSSVDTVVIEGGKLQLAGELIIEGETEVTRTYDSVDYTGGILLQSDKVLLESELLLETKEGDIQIFGTIDSDSSSDLKGLKINTLTKDSPNATDKGSIYIRDDIGQTAPLSYLVVGERGQVKEVIYEASTSIEVDTKGSQVMSDESEWGQYYNSTEGLILATDLVLNSNGKNVYINKVVSQQETNLKDLTIDTSLTDGNSGNIVVDGLWGTATTPQGSLEEVTLTASEVIFGLNQANVGVESSGEQTYNAEVVVEKATTLKAGEVIFNEDVSGSSTLSIVDTDVTFNDEVEGIESLIIDADTTQTVILKDDIEEVGSWVISSDGTWSGTQGALLVVGKVDEKVVVETIDESAGQLYGAIELAGDVNFETNGGEIKFQGGISQTQSGETELILDTRKEGRQISGDVLGNIDIVGSAIEGEELNVEVFADDVVLNSVNEVGVLRVEGQKDTSVLTIATVNTDSEVDIDGDTNTTDDFYGQYYNIQVDISGAEGSFNSNGKNIAFLKGIDGNDLNIDINAGSTETSLILEGGVTAGGNVSLTAEEIVLGDSFVTIDLQTTSDQVVLNKDTSLDVTGDISIGSDIEGGNEEETVGLKVKTTAGNSVTVDGSMGKNVPLSYFLAVDTNTELVLNGGDQKIETVGSAELNSKNWGQYYGYGLGASAQVNLDSNNSDIYLRKFHKEGNSTKPTLEMNAGEGKVYLEDIWGDSNVANSIDSVLVKAEEIHFGLNQSSLSVFSDNDQRYEGKVFVDKDTTLNSGSNLFFGSTVEGNGELFLDNIVSITFAEKVKNLAALNVASQSGDVLYINKDLTADNIVVTTTGLLTGVAGGEIVVGVEGEKTVILTSKTTGAHQKYGEVSLIDDTEFKVKETSEGTLTFLGTITGQVDTVIGVDGNSDGDYDDDGDIAPVEEKYESLILATPHTTGTEIVLEGSIGNETTGMFKTVSIESGQLISLGGTTDFSVMTQGAQSYVGQIEINQDTTFDAGKKIGEGAQGASVLINGTVENGTGQQGLTVKAGSGSAAQVRFLNQVGTSTSHLESLTVGESGDSLIVVFEKDIYSDTITIYGDAMFNGKLSYTTLDVSGVTGESIEFTGLQGQSFEQEHNIVLAGDVITSGETTSVAGDLFSQQYGVSYDESNNAVDNSYSVLLKKDVLLESTHTGVNARVAIRGNVDGYLEAEKGGLEVDAEYVGMTSNIGQTVPLDYLVVNATGISLGTEGKICVDGLYTDDNGTELDTSDDYTYAMMLNASLPLGFVEGESDVDNILNISAKEGEVVFSTPLTTFNTSQEIQTDADITIVAKGSEISEVGAEKRGLSLRSKRKDSKVFLATQTSLEFGVISGYKSIYVNDNTGVILNKADLVGSQVYQVTDPDTETLAFSSWKNLYLGSSDENESDQILSTGLSSHLDTGTLSNPQLTIVQGQAQGDIFMAGDAELILNKDVSLKGNVFVPSAGNSNKIILNKETQINGTLGTDANSIGTLELREGTTDSKFTIKSGDFNVDSVNLIDETGVESTIILRGHFELNSEVTGIGGEHLEIGGEQVNGEYLTASVVIQDNTADTIENYGSVLVKEHSRLTIEDESIFLASEWGLEKGAVLNLFDYTSFDQEIAINGGGHLNLHNTLGADILDKDHDGNIEEGVLSVAWNQNVGAYIPENGNISAYYEALKSLSIKGGGTLRVEDDIDIYTRKFIIDENSELVLHGSDTFSLVSDAEEKGVWNLKDKKLEVTSGTVELKSTDVLSVDLKTISDTTQMGMIKATGTGEITLGETFGVEIGLDAFSEKTSTATLIENTLSFGTDEYIQANHTLPEVDLGSLWDIQLSWEDSVGHENAKVDVKIVKKDLESVIQDSSLVEVAVAIDSFHDHREKGDNPVMDRLIKGVYEKKGVSQNRVQKVVKQLEPSLSASATKSVVYTGHRVTPIIFKEGMKAIQKFEAKSSLNQFVSPSTKVFKVSPEQAFSFLNSLSKREMEQVVKEYRKQVQVASKAEELLHHIDPWGQVLVHSSKKKGSDAYNLESDGIVIGFNYGTGKNISWGASWSYLSGEVNEDYSFARNNKSDVESVRWGLYGTYIPSDYIIQGHVGYACDSYDSVRYVDVGDNQEAVRANFGGDQFYGGLKISKTYGDKFKLSPSLAFNANRVLREAYTEKGGGSNFLRVKGVDNLTVDFRLGADIQSPQIKICPILDMYITGGITGIVYAGNEYNIPVSVIGGDRSQFNIEVENEDILIEYRLGVNLLYAGCMNKMRRERSGQHEPFRISLDYQADQGKDFSSQTGSLSVHLSF